MSSRVLFSIGVDQSGTTQDAGELDKNNWLEKRPQTKFFTVYGHPLTLRFNHCCSRASFDGPDGA